MNAQPATRPQPTRPYDPELAADLAELRRMGVAVARVAARLAQIEESTLEALAGATATAAAALVKPATLADALNAGREADACEAARQASINRVTAITAAFKEAARVVRRTAILQDRLANGRPHPALPPPGATPHARPAPRFRQDRDAEPPDSEPSDSPDRPETGDELGAMTDDEALHGIHRSLDRAEAKIATLRRADASPPKSTPTNPAASPPVHHPPTTALPDPVPAPPGSIPAPDT